jgi:hypothetical protein
MYIICEFYFLWDLPKCFPFHFGYEKKNQH